MNQPTPAIVTQSAVRRLPRAALLLFCLAYVIPGFVGREPWKNADITGLGYMLELALGQSSWLSPTLLGQPPEFDALLPYWLGSWAMMAAPAWVAIDFAARIPFVLLLALTLAGTWYGVYYLARTPKAQPVPFAFGGEADPIDYARAMADGGLLALIACLGLAQLSHETTPALAQLAFTTLSFFALAALPHNPATAAVALLAGLTGLTLSGAPAMAALFATGGLAIELADRAAPGRWRSAAIVAAALATALALATLLSLWHWRIGQPGTLREWKPLGRLILWFTWPAWPLAIWTLWRWRRQLGSRHVALPLWFTVVALGTTLATPSSDRSLLLGLPALATLAAFALPTLGRSVAALIDWFTLLFFSGCALVIWVVWIAMQTGVPARPAANVARLAPGFEPSFNALAFLAALAATIAWAWLVRWRTGRHRQVIWKSLVLPAGGAALCWLLLMTLWLPALDFARGYKAMAQSVMRHMDKPGCVEVFGLTRAQISAMRYHGHFKLQSASRSPGCPWLLVAQDLEPALPQALGLAGLHLIATVPRPTDTKENLLLYRRNLAQ